jgi:PKD repeat protein
MSNAWRILLLTAVVLAWLVSPVFVLPVLADLTADPGGPYEGVVDHKVQFDGSGSTEGDENIDVYLWDFGDGGTKTGRTTDYTYHAPGTYVVTLTVIDDKENQAMASTIATILPNQPPVPDPGGPYGANVGKKVQFNGTGSVDVDGKIEDYRWDFGDGRTGKGATPDHSYPAEGVFTVTLTVTDDDDAAASLSTTATIVDPSIPAPTVSIIEPLPDAVLSGTLMIAATTSDDSRIISVEFLVDGISIGTVSTAAWTVIWDTTSSTNGDHTLTVIATDTLSRTSQDAIPVTVSNRPPPIVQITNPAEGATVQGTVSIMAVASDDTTHVQFFVNGIGLHIDFDGSNGWSAIWHTTQGTDGVHTVAATAGNRQALTSTDAVTVTLTNPTPTTTTTTQPPMTTTTTATTVTATTVTATTVTKPITTTTATLPPGVTIDATTTTLQVLGRRIEAATRTIGMSTAVFAVAPITQAPGGEVALTMQLDAMPPRTCQVLFLLDGFPIGEPVFVTTGPELTFTRVLPDDLSVGLHRIEAVTSDDPPRVLASRMIGVTVNPPGQNPLPDPSALESSSSKASLLPPIGGLAIVGTIVMTWYRRRWLPRHTRANP